MAIIDIDTCYCETKYNFNPYPKLSIMIIFLILIAYLRYNYNKTDDVKVHWRNMIIRQENHKINLLEKLQDIYVKIGNNTTLFLFSNINFVPNHWLKTTHYGWSPNGHEIMISDLSHEKIINLLLNKYNWSCRILKPIYNSTLAKIKLYVLIERKTITIISTINTRMCGNKYRLIDYLVN